MNNQQVLELASIMDTWANHWRIPADAMADLRRLYVTACEQELNEDDPINSENRVQSEIRLAAPKNDLLLFRNNVGALLNPSGRPVRFGLANDSKALNTRIKSADLIGIRRLLITQAMVGTYVGQFASVEAKWRGWHEGEDPARELSQKQWATLVHAWGGYARITQSCDSIAISN